MKRDDWEFQHTAAKLADAAKAKKAHHQSRKEWWEKQKATVMEKVRDSGIEIHDGVANLYSNTTRGCGPQIVIDATLQRDLTECQTKIVEHDALVRDYDGWVQVLSANAESRLLLDHQDFLFFYGA